MPPVNPMKVNITQFFDRIYIINLIERIDRRRDMELQLKKIGLNTSDAGIRFFPAIRPEALAGFPSIGARGCFMSHLCVLDEAAKNKFRRILICEDDLNFVYDFNSRIDQVLAQLSRMDWALFYGGYRLYEGFGSENAHKDNQCIITMPASQTIGTTHCLAFQGESIASAGRYLKEMVATSPGDLRGGPMHVDEAYNWFRKDNPQLTTVIATPELGYQRPSRSDILQLAWHDQLSVAAPILSTLICVATVRRQ
jgi:hypothetical protein